MAMIGGIIGAVVGIACLLAFYFFPRKHTAPESNLTPIAGQNVFESIINDQIVHSCEINEKIEEISPNSLRKVCCLFQPMHTTRQLMLTSI